MTPPQWYVPLPSGFARAPKVGVMRAEFGPVGIALPAVLLSEAEAQKQMGGERGVVRMGYAELAYLVGTDAGTVRRALERWATLGEVVDTDLGEIAFTVRWRDWDRWQEPQSTPALKAAKRFLADALAEGPRASSEVLQAAAAAGHSGRTIDRAKRDLGVESTSGRYAEMRLPANNAANAIQREVEVEVEGLTTPELASASSGLASGDEVARLCRLHAGRVLQRDPSRSVAPDGVTWREACHSLLREGFTADEIAEHIDADDGRSRSFPALAGEIRAQRAA